MTYDESVDAVLSRLDDPTGERYTHAQVLADLEQGTDTLLRRTEALWDCEFFDAVARVGNITSRWEQVYLAADTQATFYCGLLNYTGGHWERDFLGPEIFHNGAAGPVQCTAPWEALRLYHPDVIDQEVFELPERLVRIDRVTWDFRALDPQTGNSMRRFYGEFKNHEGGNPRFFIFNEDGVRALRVSPTMPNTGTVYTYDGSRGLLRDDDADEIGDTTRRGTRGILRATDDHIQCGSLRGHPVRLHSDVGNLRVEHFRTTAFLDEIPPGFVRAVEDFACGSVLNDEGPGQNRALGALYSSRFEGAVQRLRNRVNKIRQQRTATFGGPTGAGSTPYARLPQTYPEGA
jgi:hypothetical protein